VYRSSLQTRSLSDTHNGFVIAGCLKPARPQDTTGSTAHHEILRFTNTEKAAANLSVEVLACPSN